MKYFFWYLFFIAFLPFLVGAQPDTTTYGPTRIVQKPRTIHTTECASCSRDSSQSDALASDEEHNNDFLSNCLSSKDEIESLQDLGVRIVLFPLKLLFCGSCYGIGLGVGSSFKHLFAGSTHTAGFDENLLHPAIKLGSGFHQFPQASFGFGGNVGVNLRAAVANHLALRQEITLVGVGHQQYADYERDVFIDGRFAGTIVDITESMNYGNISTSSQLLFKPMGRQGALFAFVGWGPLLQFENVWLVSTSTVGEQSSQRLKIDHNTWTWASTAGIGRTIAFKELYGSFELAYTIIKNHSRKELSTPSDNTPLSQMLLLNWNIIF